MRSMLVVLLTVLLAIGLVLWAVGGFGTAATPAVIAQAEPGALRDVPVPERAGHDVSLVEPVPDPEPGPVESSSDQASRKAVAVPHPKWVDSLFVDCGYRWSHVPLTPEQVEALQQLKAAMSNEGSQLKDELRKLTSAVLDRAFENADTLSEAVRAGWVKKLANIGDEPGPSPHPEKGSRSFLRTFQGQPYAGWVFVDDHPEMARAWRAQAALRETMARRVAEIAPASIEPHPRRRR
jgi:hypothetical protein